MEDCPPVSHAAEPDETQQQSSAGTTVNGVPLSLESVQGEGI